MREDWRQEETVNSLEAKLDTYRRLRKQVELVVTSELRGTTAEGGDAEAILRQALALVDEADPR